MSVREIYVSTDVEADGPIPGPYSMLSLGSAAFLPDKTRVATFEVNLEEIPGATQHPDTMQWWSGFPEAWAAARVDPRPPEEAMREYCAWLDALPGRPVFVGYPAGFDFTFVRWYLLRFAGRCPFGFAALDIKSYAMAVLGTRFRDTAKRAMPRAWFDRKLHTHRALDDAIEQGELFCNMLAAHRATDGEEEKTGCVFLGTDDQRFAIIEPKSGDEEGEVAVRVEAAVGGLSADVVAVLGAHELTGFWIGLCALRDGETEPAALFPLRSSPFVEVRPLGDHVFGVHATVRATEVSGQELAVSFAVDRRALEAAIVGLARIVAAHPASGTDVWD